MATLEPDDPQYRRRKTLWLMAGGAASLLIPLAGAIYLHWSQNAGAPGPSGRSDVFERREGEERKITPTQTAVVLSPPGLMAPTSASGTADKTAASSLDFIKSNADLKAQISDPKAAPPAPAVSTTPAAPPVAAAAPAKKGGKPGKKAFTMPKLQLSRGFTNFGSAGANGSGAAGAQAGAPAGQSSQDILKNLPPGSQNDPRIQAYLKSQQGQ